MLMHANKREDIESASAVGKIVAIGGMKNVTAMISTKTLHHSEF